MEPTAEVAEQDTGAMGAAAAVGTHTVVNVEAETAAGLRTDAAGTARSAGAAAYTRPLTRQSVPTNTLDLAVGQAGEEVGSVVVADVETVVDLAHAAESAAWTPL